MPKIVATQEFVNSVLKNGVDSVPDHTTTAHRVLAVKSRMDRGVAPGEMRTQGGWSLSKVREVEGWINEFYERHPELLDDEQAHRLNWSHEGMAEFVGQLETKLWVPEPDDVPPDLIDPGSGFRTRVVGGRQFCWSQEDGEVDHCWLTDAEVDRLRAAIRALDGQSQGNRISDRYEGLQAAGLDYITKVRKYVFGVYSGDLVPIRKIRAVLLGGDLIDRSRDQFTLSFELMDDLPRVRGQVEEFWRDLQVAVSGLGGSTRS